MAPAPVAEAPIAAQVMMVAPVEAPADRRRRPRRSHRPRRSPPPAPAPAPAPQRPLVDENDWRVSRPATRPAVRATEPVARPVARAAGWREPLAEPVPAHHRRLRGAQARDGDRSGGDRRPSSRRPRVRQPENVVAVAPKAAPRPAPAQASINLDVTERAKPARDDDDLQIPAFLRRQAN